MGGSVIVVSPSELARASKQARSREFGATSPRTVRVPQERRAPLSPVITADLFADALVRELKRSDRFEHAFVFVRFAFSGTGNRERCWAQLLDALSHSSLDTDVVGWYEQDAVLGVIRPVADSAAAATVSTFAAQIHRELSARLSADEANSCSIEAEIYSPANAGSCSAATQVADRRKPRQFLRDAGKRLLDVAGSAALLIALGPVFLVVAALVKLTSKGPVLFPQERIGAGGQPFTMMKFRTMHVNADPKIHQQYVENFIQSRETPGSPTKVFKIVDDPRITPIGHFLRRSSLDELPQFWNVLKGEMSLVGPRPPLPYEVAKYKRWHRRRVLEAKPGITGLWQVTGRSRTTFDDMVRLDLRYAQRYSVWTDLKILMATPKAVISGKGAH